MTRIITPRHTQVLHHHWGTPYAPLRGHPRASRRRKRVIRQFSKHRRIDGRLRPAPHVRGAIARDAASAHAGSAKTTAAKYCRGGLTGFSRDGYSIVKIHARISVKSAFS